MNTHPKTVLALVALLLSVAIIVTPVLTTRLMADTNYLPLVANGAGHGTNTPTLVTTQPGTPTASATVVTATATIPTGTGTVTPTATIPTATATITDTATNTPVPTATPTELPGPTTITVTVGNNFYSPSSAQIKPGDTVVWVRSAGFHNVLADDNGFRLGEPNGDPSDTWTSVSRTFTQTGTIPYHCEVHGLSMSGTVVVGSGQ